ncbi:hypothetical protein [Proteus mirabilis]|uniref:hypothetical protein n=2 Tax=Proteus mirabilis TaxID=584 RepID=UPI0034E4628C
MRLCGYFRAKRIISYFICFNLCFLSFPRVASANPLLLAPVLLEVPAIAELFGVLTSYLYVGVATTAVTTTTIAIAVEVSRNTPTTGEAIRTNEKENAVGFLLSESVITLQDLNVDNYKKGKVTLATDEITGAIVESAISRYGFPSRYNPIPIYEYMASINENKYPDPEASVTGHGLISDIIAPYQVEARDIIDYSDNPHYETYIYAGNDNELFNYILTFPSFMKDEYQKLYDEYNWFFFSSKKYPAQYCVEPKDRGSDKYYPLTLDPLITPPIQLSITHSQTSLPVKVGKNIKPLPAYSQGIYFIPSVTYNCTYLHEQYNLDKELIVSEILNYVYHSPELSQVIKLYPEKNYVDYNAVQPDKKEKRLEWLPPIQASPELMDIYKQRDLSPAKLAELYNQLWQQAASRPGYKGIPYNPSRVATAQMVSDIRDVRNLDLTVAGILAQPINSAGTKEWDIPIYNAITNTYVSMVTVQQNAEIDWGEYPDLPLPPLDAILDLSPILNSFKWLFAIDIKSRKADCPIFPINIDYLDYHDVYSSHCVVLDDNQETINLFFTLMWGMLGIFITFRRK